MFEKVLANYDAGGTASQIIRRFHQGHNLAGVGSWGPYC